MRPIEAQIANDMAEIYARSASLQPMRQRAAGYLSGGEMQMLLDGARADGQAAHAAARRTREPANPQSAWRR